MSDTEIKNEKKSLSEDENIESALYVTSEEVVDPAVERRIIRKYDLFLLPVLGICYGLSFLDKTTLGYSAVFGVITDNHLVGMQYSWCSSLFYFGYLFFQYIGTLFLIPKLPLQKLLGSSFFLWGCLLIAFIGCNSFAKLGALRFLLGCLESIISPAFVLIMAMYYPKKYHSSRSAFWISCNGLFGVFGGVMTYGIGHIESGPFKGSQWKYIYLILGCISAVWGILMYFYLPETSATALFLTPEEREASIKIVASNNMGIKSNKINWAQVKEAFLDINCWLLMLCSFCNAVPSGGLSTFGSILISGLGFTNIETTLMNIPLSGILWAMCLIYAFLTQTFTKNYRLLTAAAFMIIPIIGTGLIHGLTDKWGRLVGVWLLGVFVIGFVSCLSTVSSNVAGTTKKSTCSMMVFVGYSVGQIAGPQVMKSKESPTYKSGIIAMLVTLILNFAFIICLHFSYKFENDKRNKAQGELTFEEIEEGKANGFKDMTDKENPFFRYAL
ncbi:hypothetical protein CANARDRAFT_178067 [[Candida] arabinofermentans NRRL YB-2248]|uniref:Major facilitator superfamily (MFS) profile domain-containing protein n=1 Tax=[Candida] arabinofermentans NRRL YB-2248 TaxID=983967 RepID=A0A1E4SU20_9ASCO|nr:hypothetical protein CANARDRAFT_178067 [[Candida] arabinofermentans NRRL YB-2248]